MKLKYKTLRDCVFEEIAFSIKNESYNVFSDLLITRVYLLVWHPVLLNVKGNLLQETIELDPTN